MVLDKIKSYVAPTGLIGLLAASYWGDDVPLLGNLLGYLSAELELWVFENAKNPTAFLFLLGLFTAWIVYVSIEIVVLERGRRALNKLGQLYEKGVDARAQAELKGPPDLDPKLREEIDRIYVSIVDTVGRISPAKQSRFRRLDQFDHGSHPPVFLPSHWHNDMTLLCFCELLRRAGKLIDDHKS